MRRTWAILVLLGLMMATPSVRAGLDRAGISGLSAQLLLQTAIAADWYVDNSITTSGSGHAWGNNNAIKELRDVLSIPPSDGDNVYVAQGVEPYYPHTSNSSVSFVLVSGVKTPMNAKKSNSAAVSR